MNSNKSIFNFTILLSAILNFNGMQQIVSPCMIAYSKSCSLKYNELPRNDNLLHISIICNILLNLR